MSSLRSKQAAWALLGGGAPGTFSGNIMKLTGRTQPKFDTGSTPKNASSLAIPKRKAKAPAAQKETGGSSKYYKKTTGRSTGVGKYRYTTDDRERRNKSLGGGL